MFVCGCLQLSVKWKWERRNADGNEGEIGIDSVWSVGCWVTLGCDVEIGALRQIRGNRRKIETDLIRMLRSKASVVSILHQGVFHRTNTSADTYEQLFSLAFSPSPNAFVSVGICVWVLCVRQMKQKSCHILYHPSELCYTMCESVGCQLCFPYVLMNVGP